jgi:hypothetical protein
VATDDHVAHVVDVNDGCSRTRSSKKSRCRALPDSRASSKDEWWSHISSIAGAPGDGYVSTHAGSFSAPYAFRLRGLSLRIVHSLVSAIVRLAVALRLQDLRELRRIGANCNYRCNYKPIWLT